MDIARTIQTARELGDLSENADYHAAREDQGRMEAPHPPAEPAARQGSDHRRGRGTGAVANGSIVSLRYQGDDEVERYLIGSIEERRDDLAVISPSSPLGQALLGHRAGDMVEYQAPRGTLTVEIVAIEG